MDSASISSREALQAALGINEPLVCEPYLTYLESAWPGRGEKEDFLRFTADLITTLDFATPKISIKDCIDRLVADPDQFYFPDTPAGSPPRKTGVEEVVLLVVGSWLLMQSYFVPARHEERRIVSAHCLQANQRYCEDVALAQPIPVLLAESGLLPNPHENSTAADGDGGDAPSTSPFHLHASVGLLESLSVDIRRLNASTLASLGGLQFTWTPNLSRHLLLSKRADTHYLELFSLPCALQGGPGSLLSRMGVPVDLLDEVETSYATLFNPPVGAPRVHAVFAKAFLFKYWCWCSGCASGRLRRRLLTDLRLQDGGSGGRQPSPYDPQLRVLIKREPASQWDQTEFKHLWPRILALEAHLQKTKPWSFWVLFRDRRDTIQYWTFL